MDKAIFNWSGGKDSALALHDVLSNKTYDIQRLVTTVNSKYERISMHGVRKELLYAQGKSIGIPIHEIRLPEKPTMSDYDNIMKEQLTHFYDDGITHSIFGDIFLEDLKKYREQKLNQIGVHGVFPLWKRNTTTLLKEFIDLGFKTILVCIKSELLPKEFAGRVIDHDFIKDLPKNVDPCGENGEFHTFVFDGPIFNTPIEFEIGETIFREYEAPKTTQDSCYSANPKPAKSGFYFCDLIPK